MSTTTATPIQIDTRLYELYVAEAKAAHDVEMAEYHVRRAAGQRKDINGRWSKTFVEALDAVRQVAATDATYIGRQAAEDIARYDARVAAKAAIRAEYTELNKSYTGWTRAFMVSDGHVHRSMNCSTCNNGRYATQFVWMVDYSGKDEAEIVEAAGWRACTVCYPTAPVGVKTTTMFSADELAKAAAKAEREAAKAERDAKARAAAPTKSGESLSVKANGWGETFKTERAAITWATDQYWYTHTLAGAQDAIRKIATAVAEKRGVAVEVVLAEIDTKGRKKAGR